MYYTSNPVADAERYEADQEEAIKKYPVCCCCQEHIQDDYCYRIDGEFYCPSCMDEYRHPTENFVD